MSTFGIVLFLLIGGMAFWMLLFLLGFILPYWLTLGLFEQLQLDNPSKQKDKQSTNSLDLATSVGFDEIALQNSISPLISSSIVKHNVYHLI